MSTTEQAEQGAEINLEDLRGQLAGRLAVALMVASLALLWAVRGERIIVWPRLWR